MPLSLANGVHAANVPALLTHTGCPHRPERTLPGLRFGFRDKLVLGKCTLLFCATNSPRRHGVGGSIRRRRLRTVGKPEQISIEAKASDKEDSQMLVLDKEPDERMFKSTGRKKLEIVGKDGLVDLDTELGLLSEKRNGPRKSRKKAKESKTKLGEVEARISQEVESDKGANTDTREVQLRSEGDAANLAQLEAMVANGASDGALRENEVNGRSEEQHISVDDDEINVFASRQAVGLTPPLEQWQISLSELSGGSQLVADLTTAWDAGRLAPLSTSAKHAQNLFAALKLALSAMQRASDDGQPMLSRSLSVAYNLADLQMNVGVMAAGLLHTVVEKGFVGIKTVEQHLGSDVSRLLHDCMRFRRTLDRMDILDDESARAVRQFCLSYHDIRAITIEFSARLHEMRHVQDFPRYQQHLLALEALQIHAPLAHAIGSENVSSELEDLAFEVILPDSYEFLDYWLRSQWPDGKVVLEECKQRLSNALEQDTKLRSLIEGFTISGRLKSRFSIMKKLLKDGRKPEEVYDIAGLRVVVSPKSSLDSSKVQGHEACYRVFEIARSIWREVPGRLKDYIAKPKSNGYESLHMALYLTSSELKQPTMELQCRTSTMDSMANGGDASHSLYKGGLTDPGQVQQLKKLMIAAAERAALSLKELTGGALLPNGLTDNDQVFMLFDKNRDGKISMAEFQQALGELGADRNEAQVLMELVDTNKDGSVSADEFAEFKKQVRLLRGFEGFEGFDKQFSSKLGWKLRGIEVGNASSEGKIYGSDQPIDSNEHGQNESMENIPVKGHASELNSPVESAHQRDIHKVTPASLANIPAKKPPPESNTEGSGEDGSQSLSQQSDPSFQSMDDSQKTKSPSSKQRHFDKSQDSRSTIPSFDSLSTLNEVEAIRMERVENSEKSSTSAIEIHQRSIQSPTKPKSLSVSRPIYTSNAQYMSEKEAAEKGESPSSLVPSSGGQRVSDGYKLASEDLDIYLPKQDRKDMNVKEGLKTLRHLIATRNIADAYDLAEQLYEEYPGDTNVLVEYAYVQRQRGDLVSAAALYSQVIKAFQDQKDMGYDYVRALQAWGSIEAKARNSKRARVLFMESIHAARQEERRFPGSINGAAVYGLHAWARLEEQLGNWSKARDLLARAAEIQPRNAVVHQSRALLEARAHNYAAARHHFKLAVEAASSDVKCWHAWAIFEASQGKRGKMRQLFQRALKVDPSSVHSLQAWAYQESLLGTAESVLKARNLYQRCTEVDPRNTFAWQAWAVMEQALGNHDKARELLENGLRVNPSCVASLQALAKLERTCGNLGVAQKLVRKALRVEPENAAVLMEAAFVEESLGNMDGAKEFYKSAGMADKRKSRARYRMFVSRKASQSEKNNRVAADGKTKPREGEEKVTDVNMPVKGRKSPAHLRWEGEMWHHQLKTATVLGV